MVASVNQALDLSLGEEFAPRERTVLALEPGEEDRGRLLVSLREAQECPDGSLGLAALAQGALLGEVGEEGLQEADGLRKGGLTRPPQPTVDALDHDQPRAGVRVLRTHPRVPCRDSSTNTFIMVGYSLQEQAHTSGSV